MVQKWSLTPFQDHRLFTYYSHYIALSIFILRIILEQRKISRSPCGNMQMLGSVYAPYSLEHVDLFSAVQPDPSIRGKAVLGPKSQ